MLSVISKGGNHVGRERALKIVLVVVGLLFSAGIYPLIGSLDRLSIASGWLGYGRHYDA
jgi:hypothetical protein